MALRKRARTSAERSAARKATRESQRDRRAVQKDEAAEKRRKALAVPPHMRKSERRRQMEAMARWMRGQCPECRKD